MSENGRPALGGVRPGRVVFVAAVVAGKDWLSVRAHDALASCDALVHDASVEPEALGIAPVGAVRVCVGEGEDREGEGEDREGEGEDRERERERVRVRGEGAAERCVALAHEGRVVVRLTQKDVLFGGPEAEVELVAKAGVSFEILPGVVPETLVASLGGVALGASYAVLRLETAESVARCDWSSLAHATNCLVALTRRATFDDVVTSLLGHGVSPGTPSIALTDLGRPSQRIEKGTLSDIATRARRLPGDVRILVLGDSVESNALRWFDRRPLFGKRVLVTRTAEQSRATLSLLRARGADPISHPTIVIHPPPDPEPMHRALARLHDGYDFVAFTSENGVARVWEELARQGRDARAFGKVQIAAIGSGTAAALERHGLRADIVAKEFRGEALAEELIRAEGARSRRATGSAEDRGRSPRLLIARALVARDVLPEALRAAGWQVDVVAAYETRSPDPAAFVNLAKELEDGAIDAVTFTSKSTVDNLVLGLGHDAARLLAKPKVAVIGPVTRDAAEARGIRVDVMASPYTVEALVCALEASFADAYFCKESV